MKRVVEKLKDGVPFQRGLANEWTIQPRKCIGAFPGKIESPDAVSSFPKSYKKRGRGEGPLILTTG